MPRNFNSTASQPGDSDNTLLAKIVQKLGGAPKYGASDNALLAQILDLTGSGGGGGGATAFTGLSDVPNSYAGAAGQEVFVNAAGTGLDFQGPYFTKVGTAYIGGDQTGNARGASAIDIQAARSGVTQVASGASYTTVVGSNNTASNYYSAVFGYKNVTDGATSYYTTALGHENQVGAIRGTAVGTTNLLVGTTPTRSTGVGSNNTVSGAYATAVGFSNTVAGTNATSVGYTNIVSHLGATAVGINNTASANGATTVGRDCIASGAASVAIGVSSVARIDTTVSICGPQIIRKDDSEGLAAAFYSFCGVNTVLMWPEVDLKSVADFVITLPAGCKFFPDECGVVITVADTVGVQATVRFGNSGTPAKFLAASLTTTAAAAADRQRYQTLLSDAGEVTLSAGVTTGATATTLTGRFYMKGLLVEDE